MSRLVIDRLPSWMDQGACVNDPYPEDWFPEASKLTPENKRAIEVCRSCPVVFQCRDFGRTQIGGIWGGRWNWEPSHPRKNPSPKTEVPPKTVKPEIHEEPATPLGDIIDLEPLDSLAGFEKELDTEPFPTEAVAGIWDTETVVVIEEEPVELQAVPPPVTEETPPSGLMARLVGVLRRFW